MPNRVMQWQDGKAKPGILHRKIKDSMKSRLKLLVLLRPSRMRAPNEMHHTGVELFRCGAIVTRSEMQIFLRREVAPGRFRFVYREALQCHRPSRHSLTLRDLNKFAG